MSARRRRRVRLVIGAALLLAVVSTVSYVRFTDPTRLHSLALAALQRLPFDGVEVGAATFHPPGRLVLTDVLISPQHGGPLYRRPAGARLPPLLHVGEIQIDCALGELLLGRVRPTRVQLRHVDAAVVCDPSCRSDRATVQRIDADTQALWNWLTLAGTNLPEVAIQQADVQMFVVENGAAQLVRRMLLRATGRPAAGNYDLRVEHRPATERPLVELSWKPPAGEWTLGLDWLDLKTVLPFLPANVSALAERWALGGRVRLEKLAVQWRPAEKAGSPSRPVLGPAEFRLADLDCTIPLEEAPSPASSFAQLSGGTGTLSFEPAGPGGPARCTAAVQGQLRGAPLSLRLKMRVRPPISIGELEGAPLREPGPTISFADILQAELRIDGLDLPTADTYPAFLCSPRTPGPLRAALREYQPRGKVNLRVRIRPPTVGSTGGPSEAINRIEGTLEAQGGACRYVGFPYAFDDVWGTVRLTGGKIVLEQLSGRHGLGRIRADGVVNSTASWSGFELHFNSQNVALDADLYAALPEQYRRLWREASPLGLCDVMTTVRRPDGSADAGPTDTDVQVTAHLLGGSLALDPGRRIDHADGQISIQDGVVHVADLHGYDRDTGVRLDGDVTSADGTTSTDLHVELCDLPVEHAATLGTPGSEDASQVRFAGHADVWGRIRGAPDENQRGRWLTVHLKDGTLAGLDPARPWLVQDGWIRVQDESREILSLACTQGDSRIDLAGTLPALADGAAPLALTIHASSAAIENVYPQFAPPRWRRWIDTLGLTGKTDVRVDLHPAAGDSDRPRQGAQVTLAAETMRPRPFPLKLRNITAALTFDPEHFRLASGSADFGAQSRLVVRQATEGTWQADQLDADFDVTAEKLTLGPELIGALPGAAPQLLEKLGLSGELDAFLPSVRVTGGPSRTWRIEGRLPLRAVGLKLGLDVGVDDGELSGVLVVGPDGDIDLDGVFSIDRGQLDGRPIEDFAGQIQHAAGEPSLRLTDIHGRLCGGAAQGDLQIDPRSTRYELSAALRDLSLDQVLPRPKAQPEQPRRGRLDGEIWLRGVGQDALSRQGGGNLLITGATSLQMPILSSVLLLRPAAPSELTDRAHVRFRWEGSQIHLERVVIDSQDLRLVGTGTWNLRSDTVRMTLWAARPELWPKLGLVNELLEFAGQELMQYRVEGTLAAPKITARPLHRIDETLRLLLGEG